MLAASVAVLALFRELVKVGMAMATRTAMMATTMSISIRVKPFSFFLILESILFFLLLCIFIYVTARLKGLPGRDTTRSDETAVHGEHGQVDRQQQDDRDDGQGDGDGGLEEG